MKKTIVAIFLFVIAFTSFSQSLQLTNLRCDYRTNPLGVDNVNPRFSWQIHSTKKNVLQTAYRIIVSDDSLLLNKNVGNSWDSKKLMSDESIQVAYAGKPLLSAKNYYWKVIIWDNQSGVSGWSKIAKWQTGLLQKSDWNDAAWIGYDVLPDTSIIIPHIHGNGKKALGKRPDILPLFRKEFTVNKKVKDATMFICGLGQFELSINGQKTGDHFLDPGWTQYSKQSLYVPFDVTQQLQQGNNAIGVILGNGFYYIPSERYRKMTGAYGYPKMICRLVINYADGSEENIVSDASWKTAAGPIIFSSIYGGEDYDATKEQTGWNKPGFIDAAWKSAVVTTGPPKLDAQTAEPVKILEEFSPIKMTHPKPGVFIYDMGQNASAIPYIEVKGRPGYSVLITPGELLKEDGTVRQSNTGGPHTYHYILKGNGLEKWHPQITYYGFRYLQVEGFNSAGEQGGGDVSPATVLKSLHLRNSAERAGHFECSNNLFNRTDTLIDWAIKSNIVSVMTDCPHREKLGWLEEAHLVGASVHYNYDIAALCKKIIRDMQMSQTPEGLVPEIAPEFVQFTEPFRDSPEWGSNCILLPWYMYHWYGDRQILEESYPMMQRYVSYLQSKDSVGLLKQGLGDWYDIGPNRPGLSQNTPQGLTATAFYYYDLSLMSQIAVLLGKKDAGDYSKKAGIIKTAFNQKFFNDTTKQYGTGSQTANAIAVYMGLVSSENKAAVVDNIVKDIHNRNGALTAGDIGFRYLLRVLDDAGRSDVIFEMNNRSDVPGYGYQLAKGATALTESWQALPSVSNNHFMLGHILEWFYSGLAGIRPAQNDVGFRNIEIRPQPVGDVTWARASYNSPFGIIGSKWKEENGRFVLDVIIPANTKASIYLPKVNANNITESGKPLAQMTNLNSTVQEKYLVVNTGSGSYHFEVKIK